ncbi:MAG: hypothetical protein QF541_05145 [Lentisphaeria bacterium]|jgi:hypothetical protein|nr:hypothetical protein [Lentisphaeria bacterium]
MPSDHQYPLNLGHFVDGDWVEPVKSVKQHRVLATAPAERFLIPFPGNVKRAASRPSCNPGTASGMTHPANFSATTQSLVMELTA